MAGCLFILRHKTYDEGMARLLLDSGASIDSRDANGNTPLSTAVFNSRGRGELIELLRQRGAGATFDEQLRSVSCESRPEPRRREFHAPKIPACATQNAN